MQKPIFLCPECRSEATFEICVNLCNLWTVAAGFSAVRAVEYPFYDGNGNITDWMDADGTLAAHHEYDPYGNEITGNPPSSFGFSTKPLDSTLGLYYYGYRFYSPEWGRWLSRDPIAEMKKIAFLKNAFFMNILMDAYARIWGFVDKNDLLYIFANNEPMRGIDILGLDDFEMECCKKWAERVKKMRKVARLIEDGCLTDIKCCEGNAFDLKTKEICLNKNSKEFQRDLTHELQHAKDYCGSDGNCPSCATCYDNELRAGYCEGASLEKSQEYAHNSCTKICPEGDPNGKAPCSPFLINSRNREVAPKLWKSFKPSDCVFKM